MKKYLICSDVHGCEPSFIKVMKFFNDNNFDVMLNLGDLLYHGPRNDLPEGYHPKGIIPLVNENKDRIIIVKGNCEAEVDQMVLDVKIHNSKKITVGKTNIYLVHGHHLDKNDPKYKAGDVVFYGHTHVSKYEEINGVRFINPGSTSIPKENTQKSFMTLVGDKLRLHDLDGNIISTWDFNLRKEKSCGAVLYKEENGKRLFLIEKMKGGHYSNVKGHVEGDETEEETALREIKEETSLKVILDTKFRNVITYSPVEGTIKDVVFFVGKIIGGNVTPQEEEVNEIIFASYQEAMELMTYEADKETLRKANEYLNK